MSLVEAVRLALAQLRAQKLKSFFMLLGVTIGVMFLIAVVAIVEGMHRYMEVDFVGKFMGANTFELRRHPNLAFGDVTPATWRQWSRRPHLTELDVAPVTAALPAGTRWAVESASRHVAVSIRSARPQGVTAFAVDGDYFQVKRIGIARGRVFSAQEQALGRPVVVIGQDVRRHFFTNREPLGAELRIAGLPYRVVGVAEKQGSIFGLSLDRFVIAPHRSPLHRALKPHRVIDAVSIQSPTQVIMVEAMERVRQVMRAHRHLRPSQADDFALETADSALEFWDRTKKILLVAAVALPAIGLVVGGIVILNIMLVAVAERTHEIGIRKSLGARRRDILAQFLVEAATLSSLGAVLGVLLGAGVSRAVAALTFLPATVAMWSVAASVVIGAAVGVTAGAYPASRAARLDPVAALRQESV